MKEDKLQSKIVLDYSQKRPEDRGCLWCVPNRTLSMRDGLKQIALGLIKGASDLQYFKNGRFVGIEVKSPGKIHSTDHIKTQLKWGKKIEEEGGEYYVVTSVAGFWSVIYNMCDSRDCLTIREVEELIKGKRTVKF